MSREQEVGGWAGLEDCQVMEVRQAEQALRRCDNLCGEGVITLAGPQLQQRGLGGFLHLSCSLATLGFLSEMAQWKIGLQSCW